MTREVNGAGWLCGCRAVRAEDLLLDAAEGQDLAA